MSESIPLLKLFGGLIYLLMGGDLLVRGSIGLARKRGWSPTLVGLTVVAAGTSAPELMVSMHSAFAGFSGIALGNVIGSNIANVLMVIGVPALIMPIACDDKGMLGQGYFMLAVSALFAALCWLEALGVWDGFFLLGVLLLGGFLAIRGRFQMPGVDPGEAREQLDVVLGIPSSQGMILFFSAIGILLLPLGADLAVSGAVELARSLSVSEAVIGASLVAIGTSLPELSTTVFAAYHGSPGVALGNVIGSNVLNILAIAGATALVIEIPVDPALLEYDLWVMFSASIVLVIALARRMTIGRPAGVAMLLAYGVYLNSLY